MQDFASASAPYAFRAVAVPEAIAWARAFTSSLAAALHVDPEVVADVKLATSELVSETVITDAGKPFGIEGWVVDRRLVLRISPWTGVQAEGRVLTALDVAASLFELEPSAGAVTIYVDLGES